MNLRNSLAAVGLLALFGCSSASTSTPVPHSSTAPAAAKRVYNGTASVGDFLSITVDSTAKTIAYVNHSNGDSGTATYSVNADGSYALTDLKKNLVSAYEVPGYALIIAAEKVGPDHATAALVTAVESGPITPATFSGKTYNYMQFRTAAGGFESGAVTIAADGSASGSSYWPYGAFNPHANSAFNRLGGINVAGAPEDPSGTFFKLTVQNESDYIFGTANGQFLIDTPNGAILGLKQAASTAFDASYAGSYSAIYFEKQNAQTGQGNVETGTGTLQHAKITIDATAHITVKNDDGTTAMSATLTPVADASYLVGPGELTDPCPGLFTFRLTTSTSQQDVFVAFQGHALLFASFTGDLASSAGSPNAANTYTYAYGVGLH